MKEKFYKILGVNANASKEEIRHVYKALILKHHPDKLGRPANDGDLERFREIHQAYKALTTDPDGEDDLQGQDLNPISKELEKTHEKLCRILAKLSLICFRRHMSDQQYHLAYKEFFKLKQERDEYTQKLFSPGSEYAIMFADCREILLDTAEQYLKLAQELFDNDQLRQALEQVKFNETYVADIEPEHEIVIRTKQLKTHIELIIVGLEHDRKLMQQINTLLADLSKKTASYELESAITALNNMLQICAKILDPKNLADLNYIEPALIRNSLYSMYGYKIAYIERQENMPQQIAREIMQRVVTVKPINTATVDIIQNVISNMLTAEWHKIDLVNCTPLTADLENLLSLTIKKRSVVNLCMSDRFYIPKSKVKSLLEGVCDLIVSFASRAARPPIELPILQKPKEHCSKADNPTKANLRLI